MNWYRWKTRSMCGRYQELWNRLWQLKRCACKRIQMNMTVWVSCKKESWKRVNKLPGLVFLVVFNHASAVPLHFMFMCYWLCQEFIMKYTGNAPILMKFRTVLVWCLLWKDATCYKNMFFFRASCLFWMRLDMSRKKLVTKRKPRRERKQPKSSWKKRWVVTDVNVTLTP